MKKSIIALIIILLAGFIPFSDNSKIIIKAKYFDVCQQLNNAENVKKWAPGNKLKPISANTFAINNENYLGNKVIYTVLPDLKNNYTNVIIEHKVNGFNWLISKFKPSSTSPNIITYLKVFMETPRFYYGFSIIEKNVPESIIAVKTETILSENKYAEISKAAKFMNEFVATNTLKAVLPLSCSYHSREDSLLVLVGIPVNKQINSTNSVTFMRMPGGKVVVGDFNGKYGDKQKLYTAMERYLQDHSLSKQIEPFERYLNNKVPSGDSDIVNMQINYPVL